MFDIQFEKSNSDEIDEPAIQGNITLGDQLVPFRSSLEFWSPIDYELQWRRGIRTMLVGGDRSCLITSITDPATSSFLMWWLIYRESPTSIDESFLEGIQGTSGPVVEQLVFRNQILMLDEVRFDFDLQSLENLVPARETIIHEVDDGELDQMLARGDMPMTFREWTLPIDSVQCWFDRTQHH